MPSLSTSVSPVAHLYSRISLSQPRLFLRQLPDQNDFEGGRWVNGEFYYEKQRKGQTQTADEKLYGVFAEVSSDEDEGGRRCSSYNSRRDLAITLTPALKFMCPRLHLFSGVIYNQNANALEIYVILSKSTVNATREALE